MNGETTGPIVFVAGLVTFAGAVAAVMAGALDELVAAAAPAVGLLVAAALVVALVARGSAGGSGQLVAHSHGNRSRAKVVRHERAHQRAFRRAGAGGSRRRVWQNPDGTWAGRVRPHSWRRFDRLPRAAQAATYLAGGKAAPDTDCEHDNAVAARILAGASARERDEAHRLAGQWAR